MAGVLCTAQVGLVAKGTDSRIDQLGPGHLCFSIKEDGIKGIECQSDPDQDKGHNLSRGKLLMINKYTQQKHARRPHILNKSDRGQPESAGTDRE